MLPSGHTYLPFPVLIPSIISPSYTAPVSNFKYLSLGSLCSTVTESSCKTYLIVSVIIADSFTTIFSA